jgi:hypothetical protein
MSEADSGSTATIMSSNGVAFVGAAPGPEMAMGLSWPTGLAEDAVPSRPVLAAIAPAAAVSVRARAPAAATADLRFMGCLRFRFRRSER